MKKFTLSKMTFLFLSAFLFLNGMAQAQSVKRQVISSMGSSGIDNTQVNYTVGQAYGTNVFKIKELSFRPGFQQANQELESHKVQKIPFSFKAYPNPANQSFSIGHDSNKEIISMKVYSINGSDFYSIDGNPQKIDCSNWEEGLYIISLTNESGSISTSKINIQH
ncbi:MAG: T9SS type A sorting domain-containing protein [Bacteroidota bacterium]